MYSNCKCTLLYIMFHEYENNPLWYKLLNNISQMLRKTTIIRCLLPTRSGSLHSLLMTSHRQKFLKVFWKNIKSSETQIFIIDLLGCHDNLLKDIRDSWFLLLYLVFTLSSFGETNKLNNLNEKCVSQW